MRIGMPPCHPENRDGFESRPVRKNSFERGCFFVVGLFGVVKCELECRPVIPRIGTGSNPVRSAKTASKGAVFLLSGLFGVVKCELECRPVIPRIGTGSSPVRKNSFERGCFFVVTIQTI
jgi:hypothetical protein